MDNLKKDAKLAGICYLLIILCGIYSHKIVRAKIVVPENAAKTAENILTNLIKFRISIVSDFVMIISFLMLGLLLFKIYKDINKFLSIVLLSLNILGTSIMSLNMLNQQAAILLLTSEYYMSVFTLEQLNSFSLFFMNLHSYGYQIATISYGIWLLPMGYLGLQSNFIPKPIAYLLMLGAISYTIFFFSSFLMINIPSEITIFADLGEFSLCIFLLIKGVKTQNN